MLGYEEILKDEIYELLKTDNEVHLADLIDKRKKELGIKSVLQLSSLLGIQRDTLNRIIKGENDKVDLINVIKISNFLGVSVDYIVQIYVSTLKSSIVSEIEDSRKAVLILNNFDLPGLKKVGWIDDVNDFKAIEKKVLGYFELNNIFEYESELATVLFSKSKLKSNELMLKTWLKSAYLQLEKINNPYEYIEEDLKRIIPKIRAYTRHEEKGLITVVQALYKVGITVIVQEYLTKTQIKGACMIVNGKPCIILTDYRKSYDTIWFSLMHELAHVLYDYDDLNSTTYHLSGQSDSIFALNEKNADLFAREILFPNEKMQYIKSHIKNRTFVESYAKKCNVHPSIIYGFFAFDHPEYYPYLSRKIKSSRKALKRIKTNPWNKKNVSDGLLKIKKLIEV